MKILKNKIVYLLLLSIFFISCNDSKYKNYIIKHSDEIHKLEHVKNAYKIDTCYLNYYTDITLTLVDDSTYSVIYWRDRDSWLWKFKSDNFFTVDIPYNRYKGKNVEKDIKIINIIKSKN